MPPSYGYTKKVLDISDRQYLVQLLRFENGNFISISEGSQKMGSMVASIGIGPSAPTTITIIPTKSQSIFLKLLAERISALIRGISVISLFIQKEIDNELAKNLMGEITTLVKEGINDEQ